MKYFGSLFFLFFALFCVIFGVQFKRGKWLGALSGNTFKDNRFSPEFAIIQGKKTSNILFLAALFFLLLAIYLFYRM
ncbi:hypothetical protein [Candidatus Enterococcus ferrettii]|uniref:Protein-export membrane protein SecG n=1 Tax=Candidatus Enterococcus ferrettii TaxID=2815324 RepID=A0ABV0ET93_9ENTE|nr:hypothetical protein [Enterococcus sp. 665A]MBO1340232.1 hypothetical protein [Enterococcus sp. 665A]